MKALIPVAGAGAKLRPHTYTQPKALIPIAGKTILGFIVDQLKDHGITEFIFIVGYLGDKISDYITHTYPDLKATFLYQNERQGTGHAILLAEEAVAGDETVIVLGDTICEYDVAEIVHFDGNIVGIKKVDDPRSFGVAEVDNRNLVERMVEKPSIPKSNMALVGIYRIRDTPVLFECLHKIMDEQVKTNGEYSLTDAMQCMIEKGVDFSSFKVRNWYDCGKKETLLESNSTLLKKYGGNVNTSQLNYENSIIVPPVSIAQGCTIRNSIIGPNVAIGSHTHVQDSIVRDSIIGSYTSLDEVVLDNSLIGSDASVKGLSRKLNIGDNTEIDFG